MVRYRLRPSGFGRLKGCPRIANQHGSPLHSGFLSEKMTAFPHPSTVHRPSILIPQSVKYTDGYIGCLQPEKGGRGKKSQVGKVLETSGFSRQRLQQAAPSSAKHPVSRSLCCRGLSGWMRHLLNAMLARPKILNLERETRQRGGSFKKCEGGRHPCQGQRRPPRNRPQTPRGAPRRGRWCGKWRA
jgi:hypothetical protein